MTRTLPTLAWLLLGAASAPAPVRALHLFLGDGRLTLLAWGVAADSATGRR
jgi:hypothetical protein